jgi:hypothetical protein
MSAFESWNLDDDDDDDWFEPALNIHTHTFSSFLPHFLFSPLQLSSQKLFLSRKNIGDHLPLLHPPPPPCYAYGYKEAVDAAFEHFFLQRKAL